MNMKRRSFLSALVAVPLVGVLSACGDPDQPAAGADPTTPDATIDPTPTTEAPVAVAHPTGSDDVVLKVSHEGGLVPVGFAFLDTPTVLVAGDGRVFTPAVTPAIFPGPLVPPMLVRTADEVEIQALLGVVQQAGLLAPPPDYSGGRNIADATSTVMTINAAGGNFVHSAYALGIDNPESPARQKLLDATNKLTEMIDASGSSAQPFVPTEYRLQARALAPNELDGQELMPTIVDWPSTTGVSLSTSTECTRVAADKVGSLFLDADQNTFFREGDVLYQLFVSGVLPGDAAC
jgi:hypothetical protein